MAIRLTAWLEEICATQLLLGNHWLNDRNRVRDEYRQTGVKLDPDRDWEGLYHDNGSCLDITNDTPPARSCYLTIIKLSPLQLTDGHSHLPAQIAPDYAAKLFPRPPRLYDSILVRRYTIRYTSYGPPRLKLTLIVESAAWVGDQHAIDQPDFTKVPLLRSEELSAAFRRLDGTRAASDYTCLGTPTHISVGANNIRFAMDQTDESSQGASQTHTQYAFGTQMPHQIRPLSFEDEPQVLSVKRLEPIMAGNTQREDIPPRAAASRAGPADVLRLLNRQQAPAANRLSAKSSNTTNTLQKTPRKAIRNPQVPTHSTGTQMQTQLPVHVHRHPTQTRETQRGASSLSAKTGTSRSLMQTANTRHVSPMHNRRMEQQEESVPAAQGAGISHLQTLASECTWMQGMEFTRESFRVPFDQMSLLRSDSSWHKPSAGNRFPDGNIPIGLLTTLHRMADEAAAMEAAPDSDEEMYEDPSPEFPIETVDPSPASIHEPSQDADIATSQVSWSASPSPAPPKLLTRPNQQLPPDSSFEAAHVPDAASVKDKVPMAAPVDLSNEISIADEQQAPPSSPPATFNDDVEMEEYVPQGLGDDSVGGADELQPNRGLSISPPPDSVVQVHETPHVKGKTGQHHAEVSPSTNDPISSDKTKPTSSVSIVHGTYNDKAASEIQKQAASREDGHSGPKIRENARSNPQGPDDDSSRKRSEEFEDKSGSVDVQHHAIDKVPLLHQGPATMPLQLTRLSLVQGVDHHERPESGDQSIHNGQSGSVVLAPQTPTISKQQPQANSLSEQATVSISPVPKRAKRKHGDSPSKRHSRHSKRREIKIVGFGDDPPSSKDPVLPSGGETSLKLQEARRTITTLEHHDESFNITPGRDSVDAIQIDLLDANAGDAPAPRMSPRHESLYEDPGDAVSKAAQTSPLDATNLPDMQRRSTPATQTSTAQAGLLNPDLLKQGVLDDICMGVFLSFKAAYPEYTGDAKHFEGQCNQMVQLDEEDKMVPKWQWDDYIIRNRTDFKEYALQCVDQGENPEPYHRFYKDSIRDTLYDKGIVASRATLLQALHELNDGIPHRELQVQPDVVSKKPKRSRASLPSAFDRSKTTSKIRINGLSNERSRHSLPTKSHRDIATFSGKAAPAKTSTFTPGVPREIPRSGRPTPLTDPSSRFSVDGAASSHASVDEDPTIRTGDQFRDFCFAYKRTTAMTGSTNVDPRLPWPRNLAVRPSIDDGPKRPVDVLQWRDEL